MIRYDSENTQIDLRVYELYGLVKGKIKVAGGC